MILRIRRVGPALGAALALAGGVALAQSALTQIGLTDTTARRRVLAFIDTAQEDRSSPLPEAVTKRFNMLTPASKVQVTKEMWAWGRALVASPAFKADYARMRATHRPQPIQYDGSLEQELQKQISKELADLQQSRQALSALPAVDRPKVEAELAKAEAYFKSEEYRTMERERMQAHRAKNAADFEFLMSRFDQFYPAEPMVLVARHLKAFLAATTDVDWAAKLVRYGDEMVFVKAEYLQKPWQWQEAFRAGQETLATAREEAEAWVREIDGK